MTHFVIVEPGQDPRVVSLPALRREFPTVGFKDVVSQADLDFANSQPETTMSQDAEGNSVIVETGNDLYPHKAHILHVPPRPPQAYDGQVLRLSAPFQQLGAWHAVWQDQTPPPTEEDVREEAARRLEALATQYSRAERETWSTQVEQARLVLAGAAGNTSMVDRLAAARGMTSAEMASYIMAKSDMLADATGMILAAQRVLLFTDPIPQDFRADHHWT